MLVVGIATQEDVGIEELQYLTQENDENSIDDEGLKFGAQALLIFVLEID